MFGTRSKEVNVCSTVDVRVCNGLKVQRGNGGDNEVCWDEP